FLDYLMEQRLCVTVSEGVWIGVPFAMLALVEAKGTEAVLTLKNGQRLNGVLRGVLYEGNSYDPSRRYDLSSAVKLEVLSVPEKREPAGFPDQVQRQEPKTEELTKWRLSIENTPQLTYAISNPRLVYRQRYGSEPPNTSDYRLTGTFRIKLD